MSRCYYNEFDKQKAAWLRELIKADAIAPGDVDERSIADVRPDDLRGYAQCHFFAGIGIWSYALRMAGWPDDQEAWTGSCPCQPFSAAGKGQAFNDQRHLWPEFFRLIEARRPVVCFGEQVASIDGLAWLDLVQSDLDHAGYTCGAVDLCAAGFGAPHRRQRLYWVAHAPIERHDRRWPSKAQRRGREPERLRDAGRLADDPSRGYGEFGDEAFPGSGRHDDGGCGAVQLGDSPAERLEEWGNWRESAGTQRQTLERTGSTDSLAIPDRERFERERLHVLEGEPRESVSETSRRGPVNGFWRDADWVLTRPQRMGDRPGLRPVERSAFPLAHGATARVGRLRGYGDAIVAQVAAGFISAYLELKR